MTDDAGRNMIDRLLDLDCLVFSSHKTATQTIRHSLRAGGLKCVHGHILDNIGLRPGELHPALKAHRQARAEPLAIISVFREPMERMMSSFFQSLSKDVYAWTEPDKAGAVGGPADSVIRQMTPGELNDLFCRYCEQIDGWGESIPLICDEIGMSIADLSFSHQERIGINDLDDCRLFLLRFDLMLPCLPALLHRIAGRRIAIREANMSGAKWYAEDYARFEISLHMPADLIRTIYVSRKALVELFYPGEYETILEARIKQFGS